MASFDDLQAVAARWPDINVPLRQFAAKLGEQDGYLEDLYLAWAALEGDAAAVDELGRQVRALAPKARRASGAVGYELADLEQDIMLDLLTPGRNRGPSLAQYDGRGRLGGWLRACVVRRCLMWRRRKTPLKHSASVSDLLMGHSNDPERESLRAEDKQLFTRAIEAAFSNLPIESRGLLRYYYLDDLGIAEIGRIYGVHESTVSRRLEKARQEIFAGTEKALEAIGAAKHVWPLVRSRLEVSLGTLLRTL